MENEFKKRFVINGLENEKCCKCRRKAVGFFPKCYVDTDGKGKVVKDKDKKYYCQKCLYKEIDKVDREIMGLFAEGFAIMRKEKIPVNININISKKEGDK